MDTEQVEENGEWTEREQKATMWLTLSPYLLARFLFDTIFIEHNVRVDAETLQANLLHNYRLGVKLSTLEQWLPQFHIIN